MRLPKVVVQLVQGVVQREIRVILAARLVLNVEAGRVRAKRGAAELAAALAGAVDWAAWCFRALVGVPNADGVVVRAAALAHPPYAGGKNSG